MSDVINDIFGEDDESDVNVFDENGLSEQLESIDEDLTGLSTDVKETALDIKAGIQNGLSHLKEKYQVVKNDTTEDYDEIRQEIKGLKDGNLKLLKNLMEMLEGNIHPATLKSYSEIMNSTVKLNEFILNINDKRKANAEENMYEEMNEMEEEVETDKPQIFSLTPDQLFGTMMDDIKEVVTNQLKKNQKEVTDAEIIDEDE